MKKAVNRGHWEEVLLAFANEPDVLQGKPWIWLPPALFITMTILSINFIGEGLKDAFNPKSYR